MAKTKSKTLALALIVIAGVVSGINTPVIHYGLKTIPTPLFGFLRLSIPLIILTPVMLVTKRKKAKPKHISLALLFGLCSYVATNGLFYLGLKQSGAVNASIIWLLEPLLMFTFSVQVMREKFNPKILSGIFVAFLGSVLVVFGPMLAAHRFSFSSNMVGNLLQVGSVLASVSGTLIAKSGMKHLDHVQLLFWSLIPGVAIYGILSMQQWGQIPAIFHNSRTTAAVLFGAICNGLFAYMFAFYGLKRIKGEEYGLFEYINPVVGASVAVIFFGELFTPLLLVGAVIIFLGLYMAEVRRHKAAHFHFHLLRGH